MAPRHRDPQPPEALATHHRAPGGLTAATPTLRRRGIRPQPATAATGLGADPGPFPQRPPWKAAARRRSQVWIGPARISTSALVRGRVHHPDRRHAAALRRSALQTGERRRMTQLEHRDKQVEHARERLERARDLYGEGHPAESVNALFLAAEAIATAASIDAGEASSRDHSRKAQVASRQLGVRFARCLRRLNTLRKRANYDAQRFPFEEDDFERNVSTLCGAILILEGVEPPAVDREHSDSADRRKPESTPAQAAATSATAPTGSGAVLPPLRHRLREAGKGDGTMSSAPKRARDRRSLPRGHEPLTQLGFVPLTSSEPRVPFTLLLLKRTFVTTDP